MKLFGGSKTSKSTSASSRLIQNNLAMRHQSGQGDADKALHATTATATASRERRTSNSSSSGSDVTDDDEEVQRAVREAERLSALVAPPPVRAPVRFVHTKRKGSVVDCATHFQLTTESKTEYQRPEGLV